MKLVQRLWREEAGGTYAFSVIIFTTIVGIGAIAGLTTVRDQIVQQFGDIAVSLENLDQSYTAGSFGGYSAAAVEPAPPSDNSGSPPGNMSFAVPGSTGG